MHYSELIPGHYYYGSVIGGKYYFKYLGEGNWSGGVTNKFNVHRLKKVEFPYPSNKYKVVVEYEFFLEDFPQDEDLKTKRLRCLNPV